MLLISNSRCHDHIYPISRKIIWNPGLEDRSYKLNLSEDIVYILYEFYIPLNGRNNAFLIELAARMLWVVGGLRGRKFQRYKIVSEFLDPTEAPSNRIENNMEWSILFLPGFCLSCLWSWLCRFVVGLWLRVCINNFVVYSKLKKVEN